MKITSFQHIKMDRTLSLLLVLIGVTACRAQTEGLDDLVDNEARSKPFL